MLAGKPLPDPHFHTTSWEKCQTTVADDDPYRIQFPWEPPAFIQRKDPKDLHLKMTAEDISFQNTAVLHRTSSFARIVRGVLDPEQCVDLIACANRKGFIPAFTNTGSLRMSRNTRDGHRVIADSPEFSSWLLDVLRPHLPNTFNEESLIDLHERCRFLLYTPGQRFVPHRDGRYTRPQGHRHAGDVSRVTIQLYLHDVPEEAGGATRFLGREGGQTIPGPQYQPEVGSALIFSQDLYHEGCLLKAGLKYTMRTEAMFRRGASKINAGACT